MKAYLILANGTIFEGEGMGAAGEAIGEAVCTTAMAGYVETVTDPSYFGQLVVQTFPSIGNYGVAKADCLARPALSGYIVREICKSGSNFRMDGELDAYLKEQGIVGICDVDTRQLTRTLRDCGVMNAMIAPDKKNLDEKLSRIKAYRVANAAEKTCEKEEAVFNESGSYKVCVWDFGAGASVIGPLVQKGCKVIRVPYSTSADKINALGCDGVVLSSGGGDPAQYAAAVAEIAALDKKLPLFAVNLGHLLLALSTGAKTVKMKYGHRGGNVPVKDVKNGRVLITNQNHGYTVSAKTLPECAAVTYVNANDKTVEGIEYGCRPALSVQFNPDNAELFGTVNLYDKFIELMRGAK